MQFRRVSSLRGEGAFRTISGHKGTRFLLPRHPPPVRSRSRFCCRYGTDREAIFGCREPRAGSFSKTIVASSSFRPCWDISSQVVPDIGPNFLIKRRRRCFHSRLLRTSHDSSSDADRALSESKFWVWVAADQVIHDQELVGKFLSALA